MSDKRKNRLAMPTIMASPLGLADDSADDINFPNISDHIHAEIPYFITDSPLGNDLNTIPCCCQYIRVCLHGDSTKYLFSQHCSRLVGVNQSGTAAGARYKSTARGEAPAVFSSE